MNAQNQWTKISYFQRKDIEIRINIYDPPMILDWYSIPNNTPNELKEKLEAVIIQPSFMHENFESWYESYLKYSLPSLIEINGTEKELRDRYASHPNLDKIKKLYPNLRFKCYLWSIDFRLEDDIYTALCYYSSSNSIKAFPLDINNTFRANLNGNIFKWDRGH